MQFAIRDLQIPGRVIAFPDDRDIVALRLEMAVDTVVAGVERTVVKPANMQVVPRERNVFYFAKRLDLPGVQEAFITRNPWCVIGRYAVPDESLRPVEGDRFKNPYHKSKCCHSITNGLLGTGSQRLWKCHPR